MGGAAAPEAVALLRQHQSIVCTHKLCAHTDPPTLGCIGMASTRTCACTRKPCTHDPGAPRVGLAHPPTCRRSRLSSLQSTCTHLGASAVLAASWYLLPGSNWLGSG